MSQSLLWEIRVFCTVVDKQSFVTAARLLGRSPSSITRAIQTLESALGHPLLQRSQRVVSLTRAGESYYAHARQLLEVQMEAEEALAGLGGLLQGWVRFSAPDTLALDYMPAVITAFGQQHPDIRIDVRFSDETLDPIREKLDFAIRGGFPHSSGLIGLPLWSYRRHLYASPAYVARRGLPAHPDALGAHDLIVHTAPRILKDWHFVSGSDTYRCKIEPQLRMSSGLAVFRAVVLGAGVARLADWLAEPAVRAGQLVRLCPGYRLTSSTGHDPAMHAVYPDSRLPGRVRQLLEHLRHAAPAL